MKLEAVNIAIDHILKNKDSYATEKAWRNRLTELESQRARLHSFRRRNPYAIYNFMTEISRLLTTDLVGKMYLGKPITEVEICYHTYGSGVAIAIHTEGEIDYFDLDDEVILDDEANSDS